MSGDVHRQLAHRVPRWLAGRTTRRGQQFRWEVPLANTYVADAIGLCHFQERHERRYISEDQLERVSPMVQIKPELGCVFEVKASRADFLSTFGDRAGNRYRPAGSLHWIVVPAIEIVGERDLGFWGVLAVAGSGLTEKKKPVYQPCGWPILHEIAYSLLWYGKRRPG